MIILGIADLGINLPVLIAQLAGMRRAAPARGRASTPSDMYAIPNRRTTTQVVALPLVWETPIMVGNLRDPDGPQVLGLGRIVRPRGQGGPAPPGPRRST